ncbi:hypothetical protein [Stenomitos frigidus]|uniref:Uncharacterized protein n=1 Tax=Stenomitos frigidus ULC18 TaxID=2107698 RepID=A0A2T1EGQ5_9CYAN|nr:hypothetical protein [Stenomitos frigidus]PSB31878.1 hypothetical protein C7B82_06580 [Stenomitos frigidus ULC18]
MKTVTREDSATRATRRATFFTRKYAFSFVVACFLTAAATNHGNSKVFQCNRLVAIVNEAADAQPDALGQTITEDNRRLLKTAIQLDGYADQLELMEFSNQQIEGFQWQFIKLYRDTSKASGAVVTAPASNFKVVSQVNRTLIETQAREGSLVQAVNRYCQAE